ASSERRPDRRRSGSRGRALLSTPQDQGNDMAPNSSRRKLLAIAGATGVLAAAPSFASGFPERPVRLIVPYPAGGGADGWARMVAGRLEKVLGQPVVFDYRPGASTTIGAEATARAAPDGYTIHLL